MARGPREVCARCGARRFARIWTTWIAESLAEGSRPGLGVLLALKETLFTRVNVVFAAGAASMDTQGR